MKASDFAKRVVARYNDGRVKTAGILEEPAGPDAGAVSGPPQEEGGDLGRKRNIPKNHPFDAKALKPMAKALWATSVSLGHALTAYRHLSRLKSATISPDGMLGGRGYVMSVKDTRQKLNEACESLSAIADTLFDEIQAPHWKPKLALLDENDAGDIAQFIQEAQDNLADPEEDAEQEIVEIEQSNDEAVGVEDDAEAEGFDEKALAEEESPEQEEPSEEGDESLEKAEPEESEEQEGVDEEEVSVKPPGPKSPKKAPKKSKRPGLKQANSSLPVGTLPGGPRVEHLDNDEGPGPYGSWNPDEDQTSDTWQVGPREPDYTKWASSVMPDDSETPTDGDDFGLGYGAKGTGLDHPRRNTDGRGEWGPRSELPGSPFGATDDDTAVLIDVHLNDRRAVLNTLLPGDTAEPVARSDYYDGDKGNVVNSWDPGTALPGEESVPVEPAPSFIDTFYLHEDVNTPFVTYDRIDPEEELGNG